MSQADAHPEPSARLESPLPDLLSPGSATAVYCSGSACDARSLRLVLGGERFAPAAFAMPRFDLPCRRSGFWGVVPVRAPDRPGRVEIAAEVGLAGERCERVELGRITIGHRPRSPAPAVGPETIAICLGTFDPDPDLFGAQIESLRSQTDERWVCVISDDCSDPARFELVRSLLAADDRFIVSRSEERIGFYRNFERALELAPPQAKLIAFCDQDDVWHPDKLATLRSSLGSAMLVYSDQRLVERDGRVLRETLWQGRSNNFSSIVSMLVANTVTGAASLFRREVLELALPFPESPGIDFHDQWIALVALASGAIAYVDRPLYDYVQHPAAILGGASERRTAASSARGPSRRPKLREWRAAYYLGFVPSEIKARTLLLRCGERMEPGKRRALERYLACPRSLLALLWLLARPARMLAGRTDTLGTEWELTIGIVWLRLARALARPRWWPDRWTLDTRFPEPAVFEHKRLRRWRERI